MEIIEAEGPATDGPPTSPAVRDRLRSLLFRPELRGAGYSGFLAAAMDAYETGKFIVTTPIAAEPAGAAPGIPARGSEGWCHQCGSVVPESERVRSLRAENERLRAAYRTLRLS